MDAFLELVDFGTVTCGAALVPGGWFPEAAKKFRENPRLDLGIHLTFNCEFETYRWRPISTISPESGFVDENGYFKQDAMEVMKTGNPVAVTKEIEAQIRVARNLGLKPTHVDTHSATLLGSKFIDSYIDIHKKYNILPSLYNMEMKNTDDSMAKLMMLMFGSAGEKVNSFIKEGLPVIDAALTPPLYKLHDVNERLEAVKHMLSELKPGALSQFTFHPLKDTPETRALKRNSLGCIGDYETFMKKELKDYLKDQGIQLIGYADIIKQI